MHVAMVSEHASPLAVLGGVDAGGQNVHVAAIASALARRGVEVTVYTRRDDAALPERVSMAPRVSVVHVDAGPRRPVAKDLLPPYMGRFACELGRAFACEQPDVVHSHFWMSGRAALDAARPLGIPVVHTFHALGVVKRRHQGSADTSPLERLAEERMLMHAVDHVIATCSDEVFELRRMGADLERISVVPCGVDLGLFSPDGPSAPRRPGLRRLLVVSRLVERKGIRDAVRALAGIPDAELVVAGGPARKRLGDDAEARHLLELARALGVEERVQLLGSVERGRVPALLRSADVAVCVPWYEPFGIVPLEAMACGVPVIATSVGGLADTVVHGVTGLHVPPRRPRRIMAAARALLGDEELRRSLGAAGVERARSRYGWDRIAAATLSCYHDVCAGRTALTGRVGL